MSVKPRFGFALEYVRDIEAATRFYVDVMGLDMERRAPTFVQFPSFAIASDESMSGRNEPELYWLVDDAAQAFQELSAKAEVVMPLKEMPFGRLFAIKDPAGRPRYLIELSQNRPSRAVQP